MCFPRLPCASLLPLKIHAGSAFNVIPDTAVLGGTVRTFDAGTRAKMEEKVRGRRSWEGGAVKVVVELGGSAGVLLLLRYSFTTARVPATFCRPHLHRHRVHSTLDHVHPRIQSRVGNRFRHHSLFGVQCGLGVWGQTRGSSGCIIYRVPIHFARLLNNSRSIAFSLLPSLSLPLAVPSPRPARPRFPPPRPR